MIITKTEITRKEQRSLKDFTSKIAVKIDSWTVKESSGDLVLNLSDFEIINDADIILGTNNFTIPKSIHEFGLSQLPASPTYEQFLGLLYQLLLSDYNANPIYDNNDGLDNWEIRS